LRPAARVEPALRLPPAPGAHPAGDGCRVGDGRSPGRPASPGPESPRPGDPRMSTRELLRRLAPILRRRRVPLAGIVVLGLLTAVSEGVGLSLFLPLFYSLQGVGADAIGGGALARGLARLSARIPADAQPLVFSFAILGALLVKNLLRYASSVLYSWLDARLVHDLRAGAMDRLLAADLGYVERHDTGRLVNTLNQETWDTSTAVMNLANQGVHGAAILVFVALLLSMSWHITL